MSTIGDLQQGLNDLPVDVFASEDRDAVYRALEFLEALPSELDVASAAYYLHKEFKQNSTGIDDRYSAEIFTVDDDEDEDDWDDDTWDDEEDEGDGTCYFGCEECE